MITLGKFFPGISRIPGIPRIFGIPGKLKIQEKGKS